MVNLRFYAFADADSAEPAPVLMLTLDSGWRTATERIWLVVDDPTYQNP